MKIFLHIVSIVFIGAMVFISCSKDDASEEPQSETLIVNLGPNRTLVEGNTLILDAGNQGAAYLWSTGETSQTITVDTTGTYWVDVTKGNAKGNDTIQISLEYNTIKVETGFGDFRIWLYHATPLHRQNFLDLTQQTFYDSLIFHRVIYDFVIQGGDPEGTGHGSPGYNIDAEIIPGLNHVYGAVGAARLPDNVNPDRESNGSQYYIVSDPDGEPGLNGKYTVFGIVFSGLDYVFEISEVAVDTNDRPLYDVYMKKLTIEYFTEKELQDNFSFQIP